MKYLLIVFVLVYCQISLGCDSSAGNNIRPKLESFGDVVLCGKGDGDGDGVEDFIALVKKDGDINFIVDLSSLNGAISSQPMPADDCQGGCGVEDVYFNKGSIFLQRGEKNSYSATVKTFQFKLYNKKLKLIGVKLQVFFTDAEHELEQLTDDVNWGNGNRIKTTKYANGKTVVENKKMETYELLFEEFHLGVARIDD